MTANMNIMSVSNVVQPKVQSAQKAEPLGDSRASQNHAFGDTLKEAQKGSVKEDAAAAAKSESASEPAADVSAPEERKDNAQDSAETPATTETDAVMTIPTKESAVKPQAMESEEPAADAEKTLQVDEIDAALLRAMQMTPVFQPTTPVTPVVTEAVVTNETSAFPAAEMPADASEMRFSDQPKNLAEQEVKTPAADTAPKTVRTLSLESLLPDAQNKQGKDLLATLAANNVQLTKFLSGTEAQQQAPLTAVTEPEAATVFIGAVGANAPKTVQANAAEQDAPIAARTVAEAIGTTPVTVETATDAESNMADLEQGTARTPLPTEQPEDAADVAAEASFASVGNARAASADGQREVTIPVQSRLDAMPTHAAGQQNVVQPPAAGTQPVEDPHAAPTPRTDYDIPRQIVDQARLIQRGQDSTMVIKLNPEHLGELTLRVSVTGNGSVNASFHSDNATVRGIIENTMVQLKQELQAQGLKVDNVGVYAGLSDGQLPQSQDQRSLYQQMAEAGGGDGSSGNAGEGGSVGAVDGARAMEDAAALTADRADTAASDGVDYRI
ncbi:hypothetical protein TAMA11512_06300 [Selenomonas sp. TAMA-11512]|uniref:flagellar hook-length control protein FliK n=1 Tax=Selenomonas sp. TAMA-11512 TaxID=3095337 RepID=UPI0030928AEA|nr:hypothetical protein TAMA11512_06300 [Selenomonas sp. TAMA-11512]